MSCRLRTSLSWNLFCRAKATIRCLESRIPVRSIATVVLVSFLAAGPALAQNREAICEPVGGNPAAQVCTGSDYTGLQYSPQDVPQDGLDLTIMGGSDKAGTITIIGQGLQVPLPNGQSIEVMDHGISVESAADSAVSLTLGGHTRIQTDGVGGHGINVRQYRSGSLDVTVNGGPIITGGQNAYGVNAEHLGKGDISITVGKGANITAKREGSSAVQGFQHHDGSVTVRVEEGAVLRGAPGLGRGIAAFLTNDENSGRIVIDNKGTILGGALTEGILAWARRRSGHIGYTREDGGRQAPVEIMNDGAREEPLIHIVSSGTIRVGDPNIIGLPAQPDPQSLSLAINLGIVNGLLKPPIPPAGAGIRAYAVDLVDLLVHVATPKVLTPDELTILAAQLQIPSPPELTPAQVLAGALGAFDARGNPLPVRILSPAEAELIREILDDTGEDRLKEVLDNLTLATSPEYTEAYKNRAREFEVSYNAGDILIEVTGGSITSFDGYGIHTGYPIPSSMRNGEVRVSVSQGASVTGLIDGIRLATGGIVDGRRQHFVHVAGEVIGQFGVGVHPVAGGDVTVARTGRVSGSTGIYFAEDTGNGVFPVTNNVARVFGEVESTGPLLQTITDPLTREVTNVRHAGIKLEGGGTVIVGPHARITAQSGVAILGEPWSATPDAPADVAVVIEPGGNIEQRIQGAIRNLPGGDGATRAPRIYLQPGNRTLPLTEGSKMPLGVWDVSLRDDAGDISVTSEYGARAQVYEALPFVLMDQARLATYQERMFAARNTQGFWVRPTYRGGKWSARNSTYGGTSYDYDGYRLEGGLDIPTGKHVALGVAAHHHRSSVDVGGVGEITLAGEGLSLSATMDNGRYYVDGQIAIGWHRLDMNVASLGAIASDVSGSVYALGVEVGRRTEMGGLLLAPRTGLSFSSFALDDFTAGASTGGGAISVEDAESMVGRVGLLVEKGEEDTRRLFASVDIEHKFLGAEKSIIVASTKLSARAHPTRFRLGLGGTMRLGARVPLLQGQLGFTTAGNSTYDYLAEMKMKFSF